MKNLLLIALICAGCGNANDRELISKYSGAVVGQKEKDRKCFHEGYGSSVTESVFWIYIRQNGEIKRIWVDEIDFNKYSVGDTIKSN